MRLTLKDYKAGKPEFYRVFWHSKDDERMDFDDFDKMLRKVINLHADETVWALSIEVWHKLKVRGGYVSILHQGDFHRETRIDKNNGFTLWTAGWKFQNKWMKPHIFATFKPTKKTTGNRMVAK